MQLASIIGRMDYKRLAFFFSAAFVASARWACEAAAALVRASALLPRAPCWSWLVVTEAARSWRIVSSCCATCCVISPKCSLMASSCSAIAFRAARASSQSRYSYTEPHSVLVTRTQQFRNWESSGS